MMAANKNYKFTVLEISLNKQTKYILIAERYEYLSTRSGLLQREWKDATKRTRSFEKAV